MTPTPAAKKFGVFCEVAVKNNPSIGPRYVRATRKEAESLIHQADHECQSKPKHYVKEIK